MQDRKQKGRRGEDRAADYLLRLGYTVVTRRFKCVRGELDLVCLDGDMLVFVEVRTRFARDSSPEESIGAEKLDAFSRAALEYVDKMGDKRPMRFDIVAIDTSGLRHYKDIFTNR